MISVIVPVYKVEPYLNQCVESILAQTYTDLEILLVDDGSPDRCRQICDEYEKQDYRVKVIHTENHGLAATRNVGLQYATGEYIGFIDSDDWIKPEMYEMLLRRLHEAEYDIIVCGYDIISDKKSAEWKPAEIAYDHDEALISLIDEKINNAVWNKLYSKELLQRSIVDGVLFPEGNNYEDVAVMHRIVDNAKSVAMISEVLYHYRIRAGSITKINTAKNLIDYTDSKLIRYDFFKNEYPALYEEKKEELLLLAVYGISKVWRWWYGCKPMEKQEYSERIKELLEFTKDNIPMFGYCSWPVYLRISTVFMHSSSNLSFTVLYALNQFYRKLWADKANTPSVLPANSRRRTGSTALSSDGTSVHR